MKLVFFFVENFEFVGEWKLLDINFSCEVIEEMESNYVLLEVEEIYVLIKFCNIFLYKGNFGYVLLIVGLYGMVGVLILVVCVCMCLGVGLLIVYVFICNNDIL